MLLGKLAMTRLSSFLGLLVCVIFAPGCGPDLQTLCEQQEDCLGGNDADIDACVVAYDGTRDNAYDIGCGEEYDLLVECLAPKLTCNNAGMCMANSDCNGSVCKGGECKRYDLDMTNADACETEVNAYSRCD